MSAYIKLKGIEKPCVVSDVQKVISKVNSESLEIRDFETLRFSGNAYYVFIGKSILHVFGQNIEYVLFK